MRHLGREHACVHPGQYGGRLGREPTTFTLIEELRLNRSKLTRTSFTNLYNDCTSNFDYILVPLASLTACGFGIHRQVVFVHNANTLENAILKLKISNQVTNEAYRQQCAKLPIHGTGQGSGNSPVTWCFISSKLFTCYDKKCHGITFSSLDQSVSLTLNTSLVSLREM